jgi:hypothetical protein
MIQTQKMKTNARILVLGVFAASLLNLTPTLQAQVATNLAPAYRIVDLGILPGGPDDSYAVGVNNAGQVIGQCNTHSFIWDATNGMRDVGSLTDGTWLYAINNQGVAVGMCDWGIACQWDSVDGIQACGPGAIAGYPY